MTIDIATKDKLVGMFLAAIDGRDPRRYIIDMDGDECLTGHDVLVALDRLMKAQWKLMGSPVPLEPSPC